MRSTTWVERELSHPNEIRDCLFGFAGSTIDSLESLQPGTLLRPLVSADQRGLPEGPPGQRPEDLIGGRPDSQPEGRSERVQLKT